MATPVLVQSETGSPKGQAHPWSSECDCRQTVSSRPSHSNRMVTSPGDLRPPGSDLAPYPSGHVCNKVQLQTSPVCVSSAGPQCMGSGRPNSLLGKPRHVCFSPSIVTGQGGQQTVGPSLQESDPHSSGLAQHAVVLGPSGTVVSIPLCLPSHPDLVVLKTVNRKPICRPKDTDPVTFRFLVTKTGFATCRHYLNLSLPKY